MRRLRNAILDSSPSYEGVETFVMRLAGVEVRFPRQPADRLTLESFLAASLAVEEAGGSVVDQKGNPLGALTGLEQRTRLIAAASSELSHEIVNVLAPSGS